MGLSKRACLAKGTLSVDQGAPTDRDETWLAVGREPEWRQQDALPGLAACKGLSQFAHLNIRGGAVDAFDFDECDGTAFFDSVTAFFDSVVGRDYHGLDDRTNLRATTATEASLCVRPKEWTRIVSRSTAIDALFDRIDGSVASTTASPCHGRRLRARWRDEPPGDVQGHR